MSEPLPLTHFYSVLLDNETLIDRLRMHYQEDDPEVIADLKEELQLCGTILHPEQIIQDLVLELSVSQEHLTIADTDDYQEYDIMDFEGLVYWAKGIMEDGDICFFESHEAVAEFLGEFCGVEIDEYREE